MWYLSLVWLLLKFDVMIPVPSHAPTVVLESGSTEAPYIESLHDNDIQTACSVEAIQRIWMKKLPFEGEHTHKNGGTHS